MPTQNQSHLFTNQNGKTLISKFEGILKNIPNLHSFDALVGYFRSSGYFALRPFLVNLSEIRILVGINADELIQKYSDLQSIVMVNESETKENFFEQLKEDIQKADYNKKIEDGILQFIEDIRTKKVQIKAYDKKKLHAKIYILKPKDFNEHSVGSVMTGSSNFTDNGLGTSEDSNYEFNVELRNYNDIKFASDEFEALWQEAIDILPTDIQNLKKTTYLNDEVTPFELYIKMLTEYFGKRLDYDSANIDFLLPQNYKKLCYQAEAAVEGYEKLMKYNGLFLADVVGLGKTIIACIIAKKFIYENGHHTKILVVYPPALEDNWRRTIADFQIRNNTYFVSTGSLNKVIKNESTEYPNANEYDLIIIDEAHKFRNDTSQMYEKLQTITKANRRTPAPNGDTKKKVILLTATPLNNHPADIENQIYLFQDKRDANLPTIRNLQTFFKPLNKEYDELKKGENIDIEKVRKIFDKIRNKVVEPLVIRRTRKDIQNNKEYAEDMKKQKIVFPEINPPHKVAYQFDKNLALLFDKSITLLVSLDQEGNEIKNGLGFYRYRAIEFLKNEQDRNKYGDVFDISSRLSNIMKTLLVKRLESSFDAFKKSLSRLLKNTDNMIKMFDDDKIYIAPNVDVNKYLNEDDQEKLEEKINEKGGDIYQSTHFKDSFLELLKVDRDKIQQLIKDWEKIKKDPKLNQFLDDLENKFLDKKYNHSGKLVVFSESKETVAYLKTAIKQKGFDKTIAISSQNRKIKEQTIRENFDANYEGEQKEDIDMILTTEVLAEGINLHRANVIVNYDVPWNSTRLMQRIGRVNRIGTKAKEIHIFNFYPTEKSEKQIKLAFTAIRKLQAFHTAFGADSQIYSQEEVLGEAGLYGENFKEEVNEELIYLQKLRDFKKDNPKDFQKIQKIALKSRVARKQQNLKETSITYIKSDGHPGIFYKISDNAIQELNFLEAVKLFEAEEEEQAQKPLPQWHYEQVNKATEHFRNQAKIQNEVPITRNNLSTADKNAIKFLDAFINTTQKEEHKTNLRNVMQEIKKGVHGKLSSNINQLIKKYQKEKINDVEKMVKKLLDELSGKYHFTDTEAQKNDDSKNKSTFTNPKIVISETFIED